MSWQSTFRLGSLALLLVILGAGILLWPVPSLGVALGLGTGVVLAVEPNSPAANAKLQVGDRVTHIYGYAWPEVNTRLLLVPLPWREGTPTPATVARDSSTADVVIRTGAPSSAFQMEKLVRSLIALVCWSTGFVLGSSPRAADRGLRWSGWFWVLLGSSLGLYPLIQLTSYVLSVAVLWLQCTVLAPVAVAVQFWYPLRPTSAAAQRRVWWFLLGAITIAQLVALRLALAAPTTVALYEQFLAVVRVVFFAAFGLSAVLLFRAYRATTIAHIRRQVRLIGAACLLAGVWALTLLLLHWSSPQLEQFVPPAAFPVGASLIPLAYLIGGVSADLMQLDRLVRRALLHALTGLLILITLLLGAQSGLLIVTPALVVVLTLACYVSLYQALQRLLTAWSDEARRERALRDAASYLGTSLQASELLTTLSDGLRVAFLSPPLALYHRANPEHTTLIRVVAHSLETPTTVDADFLDHWKRRGTTLLNALQVQRGVRHEPPAACHAALVFHDAVMLWGLIRNPQGELLSLVLLGPRGDDDPYQARDLRELEHLLGSAALALTNSASYAAEVKARTELRELHDHAEQLEEQTLAEIGGEIHDYVLSTQLRLNIEQLNALMQDIPEPELQERLADVLAGEETIGDTLRLACERLKPTGYDEPLGLVVSLRQEAQWIRANWRVPVVVQPDGEVVPLTRQMHRALVKISKEALNNAVTHGKPTTILIRVRFPADHTEPLVLTIANDGPKPAEPIEPKPKHWGVRNMREYAEAVGASIKWERPDAGGTHVSVTVPPAVIARVVREAQEPNATERSDVLEATDSEIGIARALGASGAT